MSTDPDPNKNASPAGSQSDKPASQESAAREVAEKALGQAKEGVTAGVATFKTLDSQTKIYLVGLAVTFLFSLLFDVASASVKIEGPASEIFKGLKQTIASQSVTVFDCGANGKLAVLSALAGIGLWIWNRMAAKKEAWVPLALAGCAGFSALMLLILMMRSGRASFSGASIGMKVDVDMTILGFWTPFIGAIAATVASVRRIMKPA